MKHHVPYFNFYPTDFMNGVRGMTAQEIGLYIMILCRIYEENEPVVYHADRLSTYCGMRLKTFEATIQRLLDLDKLQMVDGRLQNARSQIEISSRSEVLKNNSKAGKISAEKRSKNKESWQQALNDRSTDEHQPFNHTDTDTDTDKKKSSEGKPSGAEAPPLLEKLGEKIEAQHIDPVKVMFDAGVRIFGQSGIEAGKARALIGRWRRDHGEEAVIAALGKAQREGAVDPVAFCEGVFRFTKSKRGLPLDGETRTRDDGTLETYSAFDGWKVTYV